MMVRQSLTRRANHRHNRIIAEIEKPAPEIGRGLFCVRISLTGIPESDGGRIFRAQQTATLAISREASHSAPPSEPFLILPARANVDGTRSCRRFISKLGMRDAIQTADGPRSTLQDEQEFGPVL